MNLKLKKKYLLGIRASNVQIKQVPCSVLSMSFFDKLKNPINGIVHNSGMICKRYDLQVEDFLVSDNLRGVKHFHLRYVI